MFSDRHYPPSFLAGNRSLRDMIKDPEEYDRRLESFNKRREDECKAKEVREENIKRVIEEKNRYACPSRFYNETSTKSSRSSNMESSQQAPRDVSHTPKSYQDVYVRNRVSSRYTPEPERSFTMFVHGNTDVKRERPERPSARLSSNISTNADSPFQRKNRGAPSTTYYSSFFDSEPKNSNSSWYLVRRTASAGEVAPEIVPISNTYRPYTSSSSTLTSSRAKKIEEPQFYTDKHFSSKFLSDSVPLSQMIRYKK